MIQCTTKECNLTVSQTIYLVWWNQCGESLMSSTSSQHGKDSEKLPPRLLVRAFDTATICDSTVTHTDMWPNECDKKWKRENCWFSLVSQQKEGCAVFFPLPLFTKYSTVIESRGQRNRQLRMTNCMHSFNTCHSKDKSLQFKKKNFKRKSWSHTPSHPGARY